MKPVSNSSAKAKITPTTPTSPVNPLATSTPVAPAVPSAIKPPRQVFRVAGAPVASGFGRQDKPGARTSHLGGRDASYDSYGTAGTPITNFGSGTVRAVGSEDNGGRQGNYVDVDYGGGVVVRTYHMQDVNAKVGQELTDKDILGTMGSSGYSPSGSHASYKFMKDGKVVPGNVAFPNVDFPESDWGKQGGGSWSDATSYDPSSQTFYNGDSALGAPSRSTNFSSGVNGSSGGFGQQVNLGALGQTPMRRRTVSSPSVNPSSVTQPTVPLTTRPLGSRNNG
jgi:murein DD-endopeptidase MepM/ murein hydrolase activator NlpD